jgi:hypothetical protein
MAQRIRKVAVQDDIDETSPMGLAVDERDEIDEGPYKSSEQKRSYRSTPTAGSGWGAPKRRETVKAPYLDVKTGKLLIKILDSEPSVNFWQHYINSKSQYLSCNSVRADDNPREILDADPLCEAGHKATQNFKLNVVDMTKRGEVKTWTFGWTVATILQGLSESVPLDSPSRYFEVWRKKPEGGGTYQYTILPHKARDLEEDFNGTKPLSVEELDILNETHYGSETVWINSNKQLEEAAEGLTDKDLGRN